LSSAADECSTGTDTCPRPARPTGRLSSSLNRSSLIISHRLSSASAPQHSTNLTTSSTSAASSRTLLMPRLALCLRAPRRVDACLRGRLLPKGMQACLACCARCSIQASPRALLDYGDACLRGYWRAMQSGSSSVSRSTRSTTPPPPLPPPSPLPFSHPPLPGSSSI
jgi:hypothetical protein